MAKPKKLSLSRVQQKAERFLRKKELPAARSAYERVCELAPWDSAAWLALGDINWSLSDFQAAETAYQRALSFNADLPQVHVKLGRLAAGRGEWPLAEKHQRAYLKSHPKDLRAYLELGVALEQQGQLGEPEQLYRQALSLSDHRAELHVALARVLRMQGRVAEAKPLIERALQILPDMALAHVEQGHLLRRSHQYEAALAAYQRFGELAPQERLSYLSNCGGVLAELERTEEALQYYDQLVQEFPKYADAHLGRAIQLLALGRFDEGWREYEWRRLTNEWRNGDTEYSTLQPMWQGEALQGKTVLVYVEQGFGDTIQFCRYLPKLAELGATVHLHCQPELYQLLSSLRGVAQLECREFSKLNQNGFDYFIPLMSLPLLFKTNAQTIPADIPYLQADPEQQADWQQRLPRDRFKVGLVWAGAGKNLKDRRRSLSLANLAPLAELENVAWYGLQKGPAQQQIPAAENPLHIQDLSGEISNFSDAAIIVNLDLVICVDTSVGHLAGSLGCPAWVMLCNGPDWRWQLKREDSPWYPAHRLFRQAPGEAWTAVVERVADALAKHMSAVQQQ